MLPVKQFSSAQEMQEHYKAVHARLFTPKRVPKPVLVEAPTQEEAPKPEMTFDAALLDSLPPGLQAKANARRIVAEVAARHGITVEEIFGEGRTRLLANARWDAIALVKRANPSWSLHALGAFFGRDHTSILHALRKIEKMEADQ
jgi:chromosomal replication initiation ATPase DnaA